MENKMKILMLVLGLFIYQIQIDAQKNNFTGTWILNLEKSKLEHKPDGLTSSVFVIKQDGDKLKLTRYHIFGEKKRKISFKMTADGKTRKVKLLFNGKLEWRENSLLATLWRKNFLNVVSYRFGDNQNEFIADEVYTGNPQNHHNVWVFDREMSK
ncbi:MAG TPA: hypothetical protein VIH57_18725 [Bacteroidales bacterium]